jgi:hypothetical protein
MISNPTNKNKQKKINKKIANFRFPNPQKKTPKKIRIDSVCGIASRRVGDQIKKKLCQAQTTRVQSSSPRLLSPRIESRSYYLKTFTKMLSSFLSKRVFRCVERSLSGDLDLVGVVRDC